MEGKGGERNSSQLMNKVGAIRSGHAASPASVGYLRGMVSIEILKDTKNYQIRRHIRRGQKGSDSRQES